jgi:RNA polymerase sigma-70 factor (ECF subfamily)
MGNLPNQWFNQLVKDHYPSVLAYAAGKLKNRQDAEDLTQEVFIKAYREGEEKFKQGKDRAYLTTIARNAIYDRHKKRKVELVFALEKMPEPNTTDNVGDMADTDSLLESLSIKAGLSEKDTDVLKLWLQGYDFQEIADLLSISKDAASKRHQRALQKIRPPISGTA